MPFHIGASIIVQNLNNDTYNGLRGIVQSEIDPTSLRHNVFLIQSKKTIALKPANLKHAVPTQQDDILFMSIKELKSELQSYNISTDSYKDKESLIEGVRNARNEGWKRPTEVSTGKVPTASNDTKENAENVHNGKASSSSYAASESAAASSENDNAYSAGYQSKKRSSTSTTSDGKEDKKKTKGNLPCEVALAKSWNESTNPTGYYMSEKLDGMRCIWDGKGNLYSRNGNLIMAPLFFLNALPTGTVLDGELFLERGEFQQCMSIARQSKPDKNDWRSLTLVVFDAPMSKGDFETRLQAARDALAMHHVDASIAKVHSHVVCRGKNHVNEELERVTQLDGEGLMLRNPTAFYKGGRTSDLLKVKKMHDAEARVVGHEEGKGRNVGRLGALVCTMIGPGSDGKKFKVGSGFSVFEREYENCPSIGSIITYRYFELTDAGKPRFPVFVRVRPSE